MFLLCCFLVNKLNFWIWLLTQSKTSKTCFLTLLLLIFLLVWVILLTQTSISSIQYPKNKQTKYFTVGKIEFPWKRCFLNFILKYKKPEQKLWKFKDTHSRIWLLNSNYLHPKSWNHWILVFCWCRHQKYLLTTTLL